MEVQAVTGHFIIVVTETISLRKSPDIFQRETANPLHEVSLSSEQALSLSTIAFIS